MHFEPSLQLRDFHFLRIAGRMAVRMWWFQACAVLWALLVDGATTTCTKKDIKMVLSYCNPRLAEISTLILHSTTEDYNSICSAFEDYITCVESHTFHCSALFGTQVYAGHLANREIYKTAPYNCSLPNVTQATDLEQDMPSREFSVWNAADRKMSRYTNGLDSGAARSGLGAWRRPWWTLLVALHATCRRRLY